ncbi:MAG: hypothetical protein NTY66_03640 [Candidatus Vogelbacteria bacterium]|nr:hypothetical protein [Candidatus Vogelbacteria bacterium]
MITLTKTNYRGSPHTYEDVKKQIAERFGVDVAERFDPYMDARSFKSWIQLGFVVRRGERALSSLVIVEKKDKDGNVIRKYPKRISLFHRLQVQECGTEKS